MAENNTWQIASQADREVPKIRHIFKILFIVTAVIYLKE